MFKAIKKLLGGYDQGYSRGYHEGLSEGKKYGSPASSTEGRPAPLPTSAARSPLTKQDFKQAKKKRLAYLEKVEEIVRNTSAGSVRGASIIKRKGGEVELYEVNSKDEALELIDLAKKGELNIIM